MNKRFISCLVGNILEWYEFTLFVFLAPVISMWFFPQGDKTSGLLSTFLIFALGYLIRPLGAAILGYFADTYGRASTLKVTILAMSLTSILISLLPTHEQVGVVATFLLLILRLIQGFCIGGEFAGAMVYLSEVAPLSQRSLYTSMTNNGSNLGVLLALMTCFLLSSALSQESFNRYGWRLLFFTSGLIGLLGMYFRRYLQESEAYLKAKDNRPKDFSLYRYLYKEQGSQLLIVVLLLVVSACGSYTLMAYLPSYMHTFLSIPLAQAYRWQTMFIILSLAFVPIFALIADKIGRKKVLLFALSIYILFSLPCFQILIRYRSFLALVPLVISYSAEQAVMPILINEKLLGFARYTGLSLAYNLTMAVVGGLSPYLNTLFIKTFNQPLLIAYYIMLCAIISLIVLIRHIPATIPKDLIPSS